MVHRRVAADHDVDDLVGAYTNLATKVVRERVDREKRGVAQLTGRVFATDRVVHSADEIGAPRDLRILDAEARDRRAAVEIDEESGGVGRAEVDGESERAASRRRDVDQLVAAQPH